MKYIKTFESSGDDSLGMIQDAFDDLSDTYHVTIEERVSNSLYIVGMDLPNDIRELSKLVRSVETSILRLGNISSSHLVEIEDGSLYVAITLDSFYEERSLMAKRGEIYHIDQKEFIKISQVFGFRRSYLDDDNAQNGDPFILVSLVGGTNKSADKIISFLEKTYPEIFSSLVERTEYGEGEISVEWRCNSKFILV